MDIGFLVAVFITALNAKLRFLLLDVCIISKLAFCSLIKGKTITHKMIAILKNSGTLLICLTISISGMYAQTCNLKYLISKERDRTDTTFYTYDENNVLTELKYPFYESGYYTETYRYYEGTLSSVSDGMFSHVYFTNDSGRIDGVIDYDDLGVSNFYQTFTYDDKARITRYTCYETAYLEDTIISSFYNYYYEGDKTIKKEEFENYPDTNSQPTYTVMFEYSDKMNPLYNPRWFPLLTDKYMVTKAFYTDSEGIMVDDYSYTRECSYDKKGRPEKCIIKYMDGTEKIIEDYVYDCR